MANIKTRHGIVIVSSAAALLVAVISLSCGQGSAKNSSDGPDSLQASITSYVFPTASRTPFPTVTRTPIPRPRR